MPSKICLIGAGHIAHHHADAAKQLSPVPEIHFYDPSPVAVESFLAKFPEAIFHPSIEHLFAEEPQEPEIAIVATPPRWHFDNALIALKRNRHVLLEKPLVMDLPQAKLLHAEAKARALHFSCCSSRFSSRGITEEVLLLLKSGVIGSNLRVRWQCRDNCVSGRDYQPQSLWMLDKSKAGGGCLFDWGCYDLAMWNAIFSPVAVTIDAAWLGKPQKGPALPPNVVCDVEQQAVVHLRLHLADGASVPVSYERSMCNYGGNHQITQIEGEKGAIEWDWLDWQGVNIRLFRENESGQEVTDSWAYSGLANEPHLHHRPLIELAKRLRSTPSKDISDAQAVFNFAILCGIYEVAQTNKPLFISSTF